MLLNAKQYRFNRGFKLYTSTRLNDKSSLSLTDEIKAITALNNGDKSLKEDESSKEKYKGSRLNGNVIGEVEIVNGGYEEVKELEGDSEVKEDEIEKEDPDYNDDSDFKKWLQNSELGKSKSRIGKKENKNDSEKKLTNKECKQEVESYDIHNGDCFIENEGNQVMDIETSEKNVNSKSHGHTNGTCKQTEVKKTDCELSLETAKSFEETDEMLKEKAHFYLSDYIPENEFKLVNYKKRPKTAVKPETTDNTQVMMKYEKRDQRSFRRFNKTNNFRSKTFKKGNKNVSCVLENKSVIEDKIVETHIITSDLEGSKRTDSDGQSSSSSSVTSDLPSSLSTISSSPSPQPPHSNPSPSLHSDIISNDAQDNLSLTTEDSTDIDHQTTLTDTSKVSTTESHVNEQPVTSKDTTSSKSTTSISCLSYSKIVTSLNEEKQRKEASQSGDSNQVAPSKNKNESKYINPLENGWHRRANVVKTKNQFIKNKTMSSKSPSLRNTTSPKPVLAVSHESSTTNDLVVPSSSKCPESSLPPPCEQDARETTLDKEMSYVQTSCSKKCVSFGPGCQELDTFHGCKKNGKSNSKSRKKT